MHSGFYLLALIIYTAIYVSTYLGNSAVYHHMKLATVQYRSDNLYNS